ncbi:MAG: hypothetical protein HY518_02625 [Candidatus Aenigmarchaeota archaeon]|nr:hypothetical protein [Candidatus Aenigmarchaeota archaeon]
MADLFNVQDVDIRRAVESLYHPSHPGGMSIKSFLNDSFRKELLEEARGAAYTKPPEYPGSRVEEDYDMCVLFDGERGILRPEYPGYLLLKDAYESFLADNLPPGLGISQEVLNRYRPGSGGITAHRDFPTNINLVSIFVIGGQGRFYICADRERHNAAELENPPGSLILLRAPRNWKERSQRPYHFVEDIKEERYTCLLRQVAGQ